MSGQEFVTKPNMQGLEMLNACIENVDAAPTGNYVNKGRIVLTDGAIQFYNGTKWVKLADAADLTMLDSIVTGTTTGLVDRVGVLEKAIGTEGGEGLGTRVTTLEGTVGDPTKGLVKSVADNATAISTNTNNIAAVKTTAETAKAKADSNETAITNLTTRVTTAEGDIDTLEGKVGATTDAADSTGSLYARTTKNANDIATLTQTVADNKTAAETELAKKVDKVDGMGLSTEDFTTDFKTKLEGIETGAQVNKVTDVQVDDTSVLDGTVAKIDLTPYAKKADLASAYVYKGSVEDITGLPTTGLTAGDVYNIEKQFTYDGKVYPAGTNVAWNGTTQKWDPLGGTVDLSPYATTDNVNTALGKKQDSLSDAQLAAVDSGITTAKVSTYDGYAALITAAQTAADAAQDTADKKVDALSSKPTAGTFTKVTINAEGQVIEGVAQAASDIPDLNASKITDGVFADDRVAIKVKQITGISLSAGTAKNIDTGFAAVYSAQVLDSNGYVVFCSTLISGGTVTLTADVACTDFKLNVVGYKSS